MPPSVSFLVCDLCERNLLLMALRISGSNHVRTLHSELHLASVWPSFTGCVPKDCLRLIHHKLDFQAVR